MELIDYVVGGASVSFFVLFFFDMFAREVFESPGIPAAFSSILAAIAGVYFFSDGNPWITGACAFVSLCYAITSVALKGSK